MCRLEVEDAEEEDQEKYHKGYLAMFFFIFIFKGVVFAGKGPETTRRQKQGESTQLSFMIGVGVRR